MPRSLSDPCDNYNGDDNDENGDDDDSKMMMMTMMVMIVCVRLSASLCGLSLHAAHPKSRIDRSPSLPTSSRATSSCADNHGDGDDGIHGDYDDVY